MAARGRNPVNCLNVRLSVVGMGVDAINTPRTNTPRVSAGRFASFREFSRWQIRRFRRSARFPWRVRFPAPPPNAEGRGTYVTAHSKPANASCRPTLAAPGGMFDRSASTSAGGRSAGVAVRVAGRVAALQPGLMHPQATEIVAMWEESGIRDQTTRGDIGVKLGHPCAGAVGVEHLVPRGV